MTIRPRTSLEENNTPPSNESLLPSSPEDHIKKICPSSLKEASHLSQEVQQQGFGNISLLQGLNNSSSPLDPQKYTYPSLTSDPVSIDKISSAMQTFKLPLDHQIFNPHLSLIEIEAIPKEEWIKALHDHPDQGVLYCHLVNKLTHQETVTLFEKHLKKEDLIIKAIKCGHSAPGLQRLYESPSLLKDPCFASFLEKLSIADFSSEVKLYNYQLIFTSLLYYSKTYDAYQTIQKLISLIQKEKSITSSYLNEEEAFKQSEKIYEEFLISIDIHQSPLSQENLELAFQNLISQQDLLKNKELYPYFAKVIFVKGQSRGLSDMIIKWVFSLISEAICDAPHSSRPYALLADCLKDYRYGWSNGINKNHPRALFYLISIHLNPSQFAAYYGLLDFYFSYESTFTDSILPQEYVPSSTEYILTLIDHTLLSYEDLVTKVIQFMPLTSSSLNVCSMGQAHFITLNQCIAKICQRRESPLSIIQLLNTEESLSLFSPQKGCYIYQSFLYAVLSRLLNRQSFFDNSIHLTIQNIEALSPFFKYYQQNNNLDSLTDNLTNCPFAQMVHPQSSLDELSVVPLEIWVQTLQKNPSNSHFYCNLARFFIDNYSQNFLVYKQELMNPEVFLQYHDLIYEQSSFSPHLFLTLNNILYNGDYYEDLHIIRAHKHLDSPSVNNNPSIQTYQNALNVLRQKIKELFPYFILSLYFRALEHGPLNFYAYRYLADSLQSIYHAHPSVIQGIAQLLRITAFNIDPQDVDNILSIANISYYEIEPQILKRVSLNQQQLFTKELARELFYLIQQGNQLHLAVRQKGMMEDQSSVYQKIIYSLQLNQSLSFESIEKNIPALIQQITTFFPQSTLYFKLSSKNFPYIQYNTSQSQFCVSFYELDAFFGLFQPIPHQSHPLDIKKIKNFLYLETRIISRIPLLTWLIEKSFLTHHIKLELYKVLCNVPIDVCLKWRRFSSEEIQEFNIEDQEEIKHFMEYKFRTPIESLLSLEKHIELNKIITKSQRNNCWQYSTHAFISRHNPWRALNNHTVDHLIAYIGLPKDRMMSEIFYSYIALGNLLTPNQSIQAPWCLDVKQMVTKKEIYIKALELFNNYHSRYDFFIDHPLKKASLYTKIADLLEINESLRPVLDQDDFDVIDPNSFYVIIKNPRYSFLPSLKALTPLDLYVEALILDPTLIEAFLGLERLSLSSYSFQTNGFPSNEELYDKTVRLLQAPLDEGIEESDPISAYFCFKKQTQEVRNVDRSLQITSYTLSSLKPLYLHLIERSSNAPHPYYFLAEQLKEGESIQLINGVWTSKKELYQRAVQLEINHAHAYYRLANRLSPRQGVPLCDGKTILFKLDLLILAFILEPDSPFYLKELIMCLKSLTMKNSS
ncbi:MAG: hypothetical protein QRY71_05695 [Candidatus Rhabdochlamydia sp.]